MSAPSSAIPHPWTEEKDDKGRTFYSNHQTRETTWQRPVISAPAGGPSPPPPYGYATASRQSAAKQLEPSGPCCTPRLTFWISCALGWIVWVFAVAASADNDWAEWHGFGLGAGDEDILDDCNFSDRVCELYKAFTAMQSIAAVLVTVSMVVLMVAPFRPAAGLRCCSVKALAITGGILMVAFAFFQMLAFVIMIAIQKDLDDALVDVDLGATFGVGVVACLLGMVQAVTVLTFFRGAGEGPFYRCCYNCMAMNVDPNATVAQQPQQQPVRTTAPVATVPRQPSPVPPPAEPAAPGVSAEAKSAVV